MSVNVSKTIAVVDDEPEMRSLLRDFLTAQGYQVECFSSATGAIEAMESRKGHKNGHQHRFAAIISDFSMGGGLNGMDFLRSVRQGHPDLPFLLITAHSSQEQALEAKKAGASGYLAKPFPLSQLADALDNTLRK